MINSKTIEWKQHDQYPEIDRIYVGGKRVGWMGPRPSYCDRGHWYVEIQLQDIDYADGFPRYYMKKSVAKSETEAFLRWRLWKESSREP